VHVSEALGLATALVAPLRGATGATGPAAAAAPAVGAYVKVFARSGPKGAPWFHKVRRLGGRDGLLGLMHPARTNMRGPSLTHVAMLAALSHLSSLFQRACTPAPKRQHACVVGNLTPYALLHPCCPA
jgi:hypothetical protein